MQKKEKEEKEVNIKFISNLNPSPALLKTVEGFDFKIMPRFAWKDCAMMAFIAFWLVWCVYFNLVILTVLFVVFGLLNGFLMGWRWHVSGKLKEGIRELETIKTVVQTPLMKVEGDTTFYTFVFLPTEI